MSKNCILTTGVTALAVMIAAPGNADDCKDRVNWVCYDAGSSNPQLQAGFQQDQQDWAPEPTKVAPVPTREKRQVRSVGAASVHVAGVGHRDRLELPRSAEPGREATNSHPTASVRPTRVGSGSKDRIGHFNLEQKKALFQEFLMWQKKQAFDAQVNR
jgi:hypothetical protein